MERAKRQETIELQFGLKQLQAELARIDLRIYREFVRWQLAGQNPDDGFRGLHVSAGEVEMLLKRSFATSWGQSVSLDPQDQRALIDAEAYATRQAQLLVESAHRQGRLTPLEHLAAAFGLDQFEVDALLICLAPALDLRYERIFAFLQDDVTRKRPTVNLILNLAGGPQAADRLPHLLHFSDDAPLFRYHLLERVSESGVLHPPLLGQALRADPTLVAWLLGTYQPHADLGPHASLRRPIIERDEADLLLAAEALPDLEQAMAIEQPFLVFHGPDRESQQAAARLVAVRSGRPLLSVDLAGATASGFSPLHVVRLAMRDASLVGAILFLTGWDACLYDVAQEAHTPAEGRPRPASLDGSSPPPDLLAELCAHPELVIVAGQVAWQAAGIERERILVWIEFPPPRYGQRRALWQHFLGASSPQPSPQEGGGAFDLEALAGQFTLTTGQIRDAVASARDRAAQRGERVQPHDLLAAARAHSNPRLSSLARKIVPRYTWEDIVLPDDQMTLLHEIVATVRRRPMVLEEWGVGHKLASSPGVTMLFSGEPGTGKTMAAEVMAAELGLDLYKIDLSTIVSKYIGETEKNLEQIFGEAQSSNAILFFDEADAIFGKRSEVKDAHDRYANIEISYLLQRMEAYEGVTILATNLRANLDEAFTRRLQFAVDFPFPDEEDRLRIWETLFPPAVPREPDLDFGLLARRFKLAGGNIRNVLVSAAYLAASDGGRVGMKHLLHGTRRELQKMGRLVNERDLHI
jgi:ATP-dependent 26S proteasome regulatory subunit